MRNPARQVAGGGVKRGFEMGSSPGRRKEPATDGAA
jgi:hypothetical protein